MPGFSCGCGVSLNVSQPQCLSCDPVLAVGSVLQIILTRGRSQDGSSNYLTSQVNIAQSFLIF